MFLGVCGAAGGVEVGDWGMLGEGLWPLDVVEGRVCGMAEGRGMS
jgi:hypothetical protein